VDRVVDKSPPKCGWRVRNAPATIARLSFSCRDRRQRRLDRVSTPSSVFRTRGTNHYLREKSGEGRSSQFVADSPGQSWRRSNNQATHMDERAPALKLSMPPDKAQRVCILQHQPPNQTLLQPPMLIKSLPQPNGAPASTSGHKCKFCMNHTVDAAGANHDCPYVLCVCKKWVSTRNRQVRDKTRKAQ
jgi:hypothetical protein